MQRKVDQSIKSELHLSSHLCPRPHAFVPSIEIEKVEAYQVTRHTGLSLLGGGCPRAPTHLFGALFLVLREQVRRRLR